MYLLDSNTCIIYLKGRSDKLKKRLEQELMSNIYICSIVKFELFYGAIKSKNSTQNLAKQQDFFYQFVCLPFDDQAALICGQIRVDLEAKGTPIGPYDLMIAAIAIANSVTLVTHNTREFQRIVNLNIEDWE